MGKIEAPKVVNLCFTFGVKQPSINKFPSADAGGDWVVPKLKSIFSMRCHSNSLAQISAKSCGKTGAHANSGRTSFNFRTHLVGTAESDNALDRHLHQKVIEDNLDGNSFERGHVGSVQGAKCRSTVHSSRRIGDVIVTIA
jgi:hypothetical protein